MTEYERIKNIYLEKMKNMCKKEKLQYLDECRFNIDMVDKWSKEDWISWDVVKDLSKEIREDEKDEV